MAKPVKGYDRLKLQYIYSQVWPRKEKEATEASNLVQSPHSAFLSKLIYRKWFSEYRHDYKSATYATNPVFNLVSACPLLFLQ